MHNYEEGRTRQLTYLALHSQAAAAKPIAAPTTMPETAASPTPLHLESEPELLEADADSARERRVRT